jgi:DNA-binding Xre family transcriptional regulator
MDRTAEALPRLNRGESGAILQLEGENADAKYLSWEHAPESVKLEIETLLRMIYTITQMPDISNAFLVKQKSINIFAFNIKQKAMKQINRLKVVLVEQGKTGKWLADILNRDVATISRWCSNVTQPPLKTLSGIAELLDVDIKELIVSSKKQK